MADSDTKPDMDETRLASEDRCVSLSRFARGRASI